LGIPKGLQIRFKAGFWRSALEGELLRDDQWERIKPFVPGGRKGKRGPRSDGRRFLNALLWIARSGARWRDLPERFGPYQTAKRRYYRWIEMGVFDRLFEAIASQPDLEWLMIDATVIRAQAQAAGARRKRGDRKPRLSVARAAGSAPSFMPS
jgi:transposase